MEPERIPQLVQQHSLKKVTIVPVDPGRIQAGFFMRADLTDGSRQYVAGGGTGERMHFASLDDVFSFCQQVALDWFGVEIKPREAT